MVRTMKQAQISQRRAGFILLEQVIAIAVSVIILATIFLGYNVFLDTYDNQLTDATLHRDLRHAVDVMKRDLRDASQTVYPPQAGLLMTLTRKSDNTTYSYYINASNQLMRQQGSSGSGGAMVTEDLDPANSSVTKIGERFQIELTIARQHMTAHILTSVEPRNI